jgi:hypothetical protein
MILTVLIVFGAFFFWRLVGRKLASKNRAQTGAMYQIVAVVGFVGGFVGGIRLGDSLPNVLPEYPALSVLLAMTFVPLVCGSVPGFIVWAVVAALPVAAPSRTQRAASYNPFDDPTEGQGS